MHSALGRVTVLNRPICLHHSSERKRFKIKQIGRFQSVYLVQSVHAPLTYIIRESYSHAGIMIGQINAPTADVWTISGSGYTLGPRNAPGSGYIVTS
jgi:hypothetical protein